MRQLHNRKTHRVMIIILVLIFCSCNKTSDQTGTGKKYLVSTKGYELYSWQREGGWQFKVLPGTNRNKSYEEIYSDILDDSFYHRTADSIDKLKIVLERLPEGETLYWTDDSSLIGTQESMPDIIFPDEDVITEVQALCTGFNLSIYLVRQG